MLPKQVIELIQRFPSTSVLVFGDVMLDSDIDCRALGVANEAPVPLLEMSRQSSRLGGAANVANNLARLGVRTHLVGTVGTDHAADTMRRLLEDAHVFFHPWVTNRQTTLKTRVHSGHHYYLRLDEEDSSALGAELLGAVLETVKGLLKDVEMVIVSDYDKGMVSSASAAALESIVKSKGLRILADLKPKNVPYWHELDLITPNWAEAQALAELILHRVEHGRSEAELASDLSKALNCDVVLKLAGDGLLTASRLGEVVRFPALCQVPENVAGAGDTVLATLAAALAGGATLEDSANLANVAAAIAVSRPGPNAVSAEELAQRLSAVSVG